MSNQTKNKKIKLFFLITKGNMGGAQRYVYDLCSQLPKNKYEIKVVIGEGTLLAEKLNQIDIPVIKINSLKRDTSFTCDLASFFELCKIFKQEKPDIIHLNSSKMGILGAFAGRLTGVPKIIFTGHGWAFNEKRNPVSKFLLKLTYWLTIILCHKTIAVSEKTKRDIVSLPFIQHKLVVIHNGIKPIIFEDRLTARQFLTSRSTILKNTLTSNLLWLGTIAELHPSKGLDIAINSIAGVTKNNSDFIYMIIGDGEKRKELEDLVKKLGLDQKVFLLGFIPDARKYLKAFDVFILPSRTEAFPYVLLEAGLAGLPIIASSVGGIPEIIEHEKSGLLVSPENPNTLTKEINNLLADQTLLTRYGGELKEKITRDFSLEEMVKKTEVLYERENL